MQTEFLSSLFKNNDISFRDIKLDSIASSADIRIPEQFQIACTLLSNDNDIAIAFNPATRAFNLDKLNRATRKNFQMIDNSETFKEKLMNKAGGNINSEDGLYFYLDDALGSQNELYLLDNDHNQAYALDVSQLNKLSSDKLIGISFSEDAVIQKEAKTTMEFKERVKALHNLPPMPDTASRILQLRSKPDVKVEEIVMIVENDPLLAAQIISYANSAFFGQAGSVKSIKDAIFRVLGVDAVMNMALALSIGSTFKIPNEGPVGARAVWRSSVYTASLMQRLTMLMPWGKRPNPGTAYLVGLLHDIGLLVLGHLFHDEFTNFNKYLEENPEQDIMSAEMQILGITHTEVGKMVMRMWKMPEELITVASHHHDKNYRGEFEEYTRLLIVVESLLAPHGLSCSSKSSDDDLPSDMLAELELDEEEVIIAADEVLSEGEVIKKLADQMCA